MDYLLKVQTAIKYIEENLTNNISLDDLAKQAHFSSYYFHRLFQSIVGEPVMEYVRRKRLLYAAGEILNCNTSIADMAYKYHFNSQDVFTRAFKRLYGVTPSEYRKINKQANPYISKKINAEVYSMFDLYLSQKIQCTNNEKKECLELLELILNLSEKARKHGLFSLESEIKNSNSVFMRKALQFIIDGIEPNYIRSILHNYITIGDFKGKALLERILVTEGILSIQAGENPLIIKEKLSSYFGEDFIMEIDKYFCNDIDSQNYKIQTYCSTIRNQLALAPATPLFEGHLQNLSDRSLQRLLREIDLFDIVKAFKGSSGKIQVRILENLSKKIALLVIDESENLKEVAPQQVIQSQNHILETMKKLQEDGEIILYSPQFLI